MDIVAVDDISFEIADVEFLTIANPSESGKSMSPRMIAGLGNITKGTVHIGNRVVDGVQPRDQDVATVFQNYILYPYMTARKNISHELQLTTDLPKDEISQWAMDAVEMTDVTDQLDKHPGSLSEGQQQRIAAGHAIMCEPSVFLFSEPLPNLGAKLKLYIQMEPQQL